MKAHIKTIFTSLTEVYVSETNKLSGQCNLFADENAPNILFNEFRCPIDYENYCDKSYNDLKSHLQNLNLIEIDILTLIEVRFEIVDFKKRLFPKNDPTFFLERVRHSKKYPRSNYSNEEIKGKVICFLKIQLRLLQRMEKLISFHIMKISSKPIQTFDTIPPLFENFVDKNAISEVGFHKLRVYNSNTNTTNLSFNGSKSDFEVLVHILYLEKVFIYADGKSATKPELRELLSFIGNFKTAKNPDSTLFQAKERAEKSENIFTRLFTAYEAFKYDKL